MKQPALFFIIASTCSGTLPAWANDKLEEVIVTSSRVEMPLRKIGTSVSVVTEQQIQDKSAVARFTADTQGGSLACTPRITD